MRQHIREFAEDVAEFLPIAEPIVEIGSRAAPGQEGFADIRSLFAGRDYTGCDAQEGPGVDRVEDVHALTFSDGSVGTVVMLDTLEHVADPIRALKEVHRVLRPGGLVALSSVMLFPIHEHPFDYWRFTPDGFRVLLRPFASTLVLWLGIPELPETVLGIGIKDDDRAIAPESLPRTMENRARMTRTIDDLVPPQLSTRELWHSAVRATGSSIKRRLRRRVTT